jgi:hypothetical protein
LTPISRPYEITKNLVSTYPGLGCLRFQLILSNAARGVVYHAKPIGRPKAFVETHSQELRLPFVSNGDNYTLKLLVVLALESLVTNSAYAQSAGVSHPDSVLRSILVRIEADLEADGYHPVRVASRAVGRFQGHHLLLRGDSVVVITRSGERAIALADVDSVWVRRDAGRDLALVFGGVCAVSGGALGGVIATGPDSGGGSPFPAIAIGAGFGGVICGAAGWVLGSVIQTWRLHYPLALESST